MAHAPILLTRPERAARRFANQIAQRLGSGPIVISPVLKIVASGAAIEFSRYSGVIVTSENGLLGVEAAQVAQMPAWCVGNRTAEAARRKGFAARSAQGALPELVDLICAARPEGRLLYLRGQMIAGDVAGPLRAAGLCVDEIVVYDQRPGLLTPEAAALLARPGPVLIPLFSVRSAQALAKMLKKPAASLFVAAISPAVADAFSVQSAAMTLVALRPDSDAMLDRLNDLQSGLRA